ncbi:MAG: glycosyl transferase [Bacteroidetes bacterium]|nr:glycosyl transferase [Bacteroidota bacterium]
MYYFATFFDKNYLSRGIVLYKSIEKQEIEFTFFVLCLDTDTYTFFKSHQKEFPRVQVLTLLEVESKYTELKLIKNERTIIEYYFTLSPYLPHYLLEKFNLKHICTLDADILFFSNPALIFKFLEQYSIVITPHKFSREIEYLCYHGIYNVSFQIFKNDSIGIKCLNKWKQQCFVWCKDYVDATTGLYADQKYLDTWTEEYPDKVKVLNDSCTGIAPWNLNRFKLSYFDNTFFSDNYNLIFYHFHHFKILNRFYATNGFNMYGIKTTKVVRMMYLFYWKELLSVNRILSVNKDSSQRVNLVLKPILKIIDERECFLKLGDFIISIKTKNIPSILIRVIQKFYG